MEEIKKRIETLISEKHDSKYSDLWSTINKIIPSVEAHNKLIISQMTNFDIHDSEHSKSVLKIIEKLLGDNIEKISLYELILIYVAAYLHDSAMALPDWEFKLLKAVEGTDEVFDNTLAFTIKNDFKPVHSLMSAVEIIKENKKALYNSFDEISEYVFSYPNENEMITSLARLMIDYETYRNGYVDTLKSKLNSTCEYLRYSEELRINYIRENHHKQATKNVACLEEKIKPAIGNGDARQFINILADVCKSHGEDLSFVQNLNKEALDWLDEKNNVQFVAMMIRLGYIIHFNSERAPVSLYVEKMIIITRTLKCYKH